MKRIFQGVIQRSRVGFQNSGRNFNNYSPGIFSFFDLIAKSHVMRYLKSNLNYSVSKSIDRDGAPIEILFVVARKDAKFLSSSIKGALESTRCHTIISVTVICPGKDLVFFQGIADSIRESIQVMAEDEVINQVHLSRIKDTFGPRSGWVLQQLLKIYYAKNSKSPGILIVDADTILLRNRVWLDSNSVQILMPTWERHTPYYDFLRINSYKIGDNIFSYISHHMLIQPKILREMLVNYGLDNLDVTIDKISKFSSSGNSPFSIDYEMYAQYLIAVHPVLVRYEKWANFSVNNLAENDLDTLLKIWKNRYNSISAHSYNQC